MARVPLTREISFGRVCLCKRCRHPGQRRSPQWVTFPAWSLSEYRCGVQALPNRPTGKNSDTLLHDRYLCGPPAWNRRPGTARLEAYTWRPSLASTSTHWDVGWCMDTSNTSRGTPLPDAITLSGEELDWPQCKRPLRLMCQRLFTRKTSTCSFLRPLLHDKDGPCAPTTNPPLYKNKSVLRSGRLSRAAEKCRRPPVPTCPGERKRTSEAGPDASHRLRERSTHAHTKGLRKEAQNCPVSLKGAQEKTMFLPIFFPRVMVSVEVTCNRPCLLPCC